MTDLHLILAKDERCGVCGEPASRLIRCRKCRTVIGRCSAHGQYMLRLAGEHCASGKAAP